jgi:hypothetical protein
MRIFVILLLLVGCNDNNQYSDLEKENILLHQKVDSLKNELHKCDMIMESYEGMPINI